MDIEVKTNDLCNKIITLNKDIIEIYIKKYKIINNVDMNEINDVCLLNGLIGLYYNKGIILDIFVKKSENNNNFFFQNIPNKIIETIKNIYVTPEDFIKEINNIIISCNNYILLITDNYNRLNNLELEITKIQSDYNTNNKIKYVGLFKYLLNLKDTINIIKNDIFNEINYINLQATYLKYDILTSENIEQLVEYLDKLNNLKNDLKCIKIPFLFKGTKNIEFNINNGLFNINKYIEIVKILTNERTYNIIFI